MRDAVVESVVNMLVGFGLSVLVAWLVVEWSTASFPNAFPWILGVVFSLLSLLRSFCVRLFFRWFYGA